MKKLFLMVLTLSLMMGFASAVTLTVNSPVSGAFNNRTVLVNLSSNGVTANFYYIKNIAGPNNWILLCSATQSCTKTIVLSNGMNNPTFKAVTMNGSSDTKDGFSITIDTVKPVIWKISPNSNVFVNSVSTFNVTYSEDNLANITLNYGTFEDSRQIPQMCTSGKNQVCSFSPDLTDFDGQMINFSFSVIDKAGNSVSSRTNYVKVDLTNPVVNYSRIINGPKVTFFFEVSEPNFDKIAFIDSKEVKPVWRTLCSNLIVGRCYTFRNFAYGSHSLTIKTTDKAGNTDTETDDFTIA